MTKTDFSADNKWSDETPASSAVLLPEYVHIQQESARVRHYFVLSLFSVICLCPATGLIALAYSIKSSAKADVNFHDKARLYSRRALLWNIISIAVAILGSIVVILYAYQMSRMVIFHDNVFIHQKQANDAHSLIQSITDDRNGY